MANDDATLGWAKMLALLAGVAGASGCDGGKVEKFVFPPGHPCERLSACDSYVVPPDGDATAIDWDAGVPDGGDVRSCGICVVNG